MNHSVKRSAVQLRGEDLNDPAVGWTAELLEWPETFSSVAMDVVRYFEGTMFLFRYRDRFVVTDESLQLTETTAPVIGGPRFVSGDLGMVEAWLESIAEEANENPDLYPGWLEMFDDDEF